MGGGVSAPEKPKELVLVGMGPGNAYLLRTIVDKGWLGTVVNVTALDLKDSLHHNIAAPRSLVDDSFVDRQYWAYELFGKMATARSKKGTNVAAAYRFHQARVTSITEDTVTATKVADGLDIAITFDYCVIGTGSTAPFPGKDTATDTATSRARYRRVASLVRDAKSIVVVGGGPTGVEVAGEFGYYYGGGKASAGNSGDAKKVTLVHNGQALLTGYKGLKDKVGARAATKLAGLGVDVLLGQRVDLAALRGGGDEGKTADESKGDGSAESKGEGDEAKTADVALPDSVITGPVTVKTTKGASIEADVVLVCTGFRVNSAAYAESLAGSIDERGMLKVDMKHQVIGHEGRIWAIGDCCNVPEYKLAYIAGIHGKYVAKSVAAHAVGKGASVKARKAESPAMLVTLGPKDGVGQLMGMVIGKKMVPSVKGGDLFVKKIRGEILGKVQ